ncbi:MAG: ABC transporter ATP-binding protein [Myxococcota bacterium]|nr:ABC transporter ATP-binding protein [Deltaproteobacteria bacterium]MDQ3335479.1 ABC transporter ATP-binding protein [Myxococcota bacterium]
MLEVANLEVVYHSVVLVLKGVSLQVPDGGIVALLGPNGAGKTTTLRAITGLLDVHHGKVTKGRVTWQGEDLLARRADAIVRGGIAQVMEGRRILADLTVEENLRAGAYGRTRADTGEEIERLCKRFPILGDRRRQQAGYLSGGEQQMLAIARALIARPRLLLLDEPSLGLAPKLQREVARLITEINAEGVAILLVEQNAMMALDLAHRGYIMENGKIVLDGTAADLKSDKDIREFYLGLGGSAARSYREVKLYRRRKRWLS